MNLFKDYKKNFLLFLEELKKENEIKFPDKILNLTTELPPKEIKSDMSCNAPMILARFNSLPPMQIGLLLKDKFLSKFNEFEKIEILHPGFMNISFKKSFWKNYMFSIVTSGSNYGSNNDVKKKYNLEFVSANPTGPLHVGHCRGAIIGDVISNLLKFNGNQVIKEYYVNDYGGQIKNFTYSVYYRIIELTKNKSFPKKDDLYPGDYIIEIAKRIIKEKVIKNFNNLENIFEELSRESLKISMELIKNNLKILGIKHDNFVYETDLIKKKLVTETIKNLESKKFVYKGKLEPPKGEKDKDWKIREQLLFNSTKFGDDTDRALQKYDGTWTYFASDIAYHNYKIQRNFDILIDILGADHAGYIKRITAATKALSNDKTNLICKVSQLVKLFKNGKPFKMSKRKGDYITVDDLVDEVGKDSVRFMMLSRSNDVELDFDFEKVTEKSKENPVYYVQYAYARINSIFKTANLNLSDNINFKDDDFSLNDHEKNILKKISEWPKCVDISSSKLEPHRISFYLYELVTIFHFYWSLGNNNEHFRFISKDNKVNHSRFKLLQALAIVIKNGMSILGVSTPSKM